MDERHKQFSQMLDDHHQWPCPYLFKFIVPAEKIEEFSALFVHEAMTTRPSKNGKYVAVTFESHMCSSHDVMGVYHKASAISGVLSL
ncbi:MAG: DUF493 family protein [Pseudodesulfovibrio sp.]